jgi:hypothetical protein
MKFALQVQAYDVDRSINYMLRNIAPWVDKIYLTYPARPWNYVPSSRETRTNPTKLESIDTSICGDRIEIIKGDWLVDEDTRNECVDRAIADGCDWMIIQDADEFYTERSWDRIYTFLKSNPPMDAYKTTWYNFWKSSQFCLVDGQNSIKGTSASFAFRLASGIRFKRSRSLDAKELGVLDYPCYHYSFAMSDKEAYEKITSYSHSHQMDGPKWYRLKWQNWALNTELLHPMTPTTWRRAIRFPLDQPDFAEPFNYLVDPSARSPLSLEETIYDARAKFTDFRRRLLRRS